MKLLRFAMFGLALSGLTLAVGCHTEKSTRTTEVHRTDGNTTVKKHETRETDRGKTEKTEKSTYHD